MEVELDVHFKLAHLLTCLAALSRIKIMRVTYGSSSVDDGTHACFVGAPGAKNMTYVMFGANNKMHLSSFANRMFN